MENRSQIFLGMLALAVALVIGALVAAHAVKTVKRSGDTITVTGSAKRPIRSDFVVWRGSVTAQKPNLQDAFGEIRNHANRLRAYFTEKGIPDSVISFKPISTWAIPETYADGRQTGRTLAYQLRQMFEIRSSEVDRITALSSDATDLISEGVNFESYSPEYLITYLSELRSEMLSEAAADARQRALSMAESVGNTIGALRNARMGVFQITARNSTDVSDYGIYDTSALEKDITAVVRLTFAIR